MPRPAAKRHRAGSLPGLGTSASRQVYPELVSSIGGIPAREYFKRLIHWHKAPGYRPMSDQCDNRHWAHGYAAPHIHAAAA
jgi:hypothetical protein